MQERELKLHVPAASRPAMDRVLRQAGATELRLHAQYFDTPDGELSRQGIALRLRLEGEQWVQTAKGRGPDELTRIEINHPRHETAPALDLAVYRNTPLQHAFDRLSQPLLLRYETLITRCVLQHNTGRSHVELAFDTGVIKSGRLELQVCELELEQIQGDAADLFMLGRQWLQRYGLILDLRSKAERGVILAEMTSPAQADDARSHTASSSSKRACPPLLKAQHAEEVVLQADMTLPQAYHHCVNQCLSQIVRNAALLAGVEPLNAGSDLHVEYVHQLRVGIRRLRACQQLFKKWIAIDKSPQQLDLRRYFSMLGHVRNNDVVRLTIAPRLRAAGMPALSPSADAGAQQPSMVNPQALASDTPLQRCLLALLEDLVSETGLAATSCAAESRNPATYPNSSAQPPVLGRRLAKRLNKWLEQLSTQGRSFTGLTADAQHTLRKQAKRIRYGLDFSAGVLRPTRTAKVRKTLIKIQKTLGELNDLYVAQAHYETLAAEQPPALFALGWLKAMQAQKQKQAQTLFIQLSRVPKLKKVRA